MQPMRIRGLGFSPGEAEPKLCDPGRESGKSVIGMRGVRVRACVCTYRADEKNKW